MLCNDFQDIIIDLKRTKKAVVAIGCSFVQAAELGDAANKARVSFVNQLCCNYLNNQYTPINFGQEGAGNFAAISRLFLHNIPWKELEEIIIIFLPTGLQRFDIIRDDNRYGFEQEFNTIYPFYDNQSTQNKDVNSLNNSFSKIYHSEKFEVLNFILNFQILNTWINEHNAKLVVFPAFNNEYNKEYFSKILNTTIVRDQKSLQINEKIFNKDNRDVNGINFLLNTIPWKNFITIDESYNFFDLCFKNDENYKKEYSMFQVIDQQIMKNNDWIMPGGHPSEKGHKLLARKLFKIISKKNLVSII